LSSELKEIESSLKLNPNNEVVIKLKSNLEKEIKLIKQRVKLFKKLERSGLIMYSNSQNSEQETPKK
jgi:peptide subunit release factor 1 (eRF1)